MKLLSICLLVLLFASCDNQDTLFEKLPASQTNVTFKNSLEEAPEFNVLKYGYFYNGGGVAAADFNNDGLVDLYFTGNLNANKLYLNKTEPGSGKLTFDDITDKAGVGAAEGWNTGVSVVDINADGWLDIYVCRSAATDARLRRNLLFINNKNLRDGYPTFTEKAAEYGLDDSAYSTQAAFFDYDRDGDLDCFLLNHSVQEYAGFSRMISDYKQQTNTNYSSKLYQNQNGKFVDVSVAAGLTANVLSFGLAVAVSDFNNDGWLDFYVSNDYNENDYLYINQQNGRSGVPAFKEVVRESMGHTSLYSMGSDAADVNNDGRIDLLTLDMLPERNERIKLTSGDDNYDKYAQLLRSGFHHQTMRNMLQLNVGENKFGDSGAALPVFSEIGQLAGISNTDWSWAGLFADFDNDGWKDLFVSNGYARDYTNMEFLKFTMDEQLKARQTGKPAATSDPLAVIAKMPSINEPNFIFRNRSGDPGGQLTFANETSTWGFEEKNQSNGAVYADLDNDGDLDLVINNVNAEASIYENHADMKGPNHHLSLQLKSPNLGQLMGARVTVWAGGHMQVQEFMPVRGFQSAMYGPLLFGLGKASTVDSMRIRWADGKTQFVSSAGLNKVQNGQLTVAYAPTADNQPVTPPKTFWQATGGMAWTHQQQAVNDFKIQPLLPYMLSPTGPYFAIGDANGDGRDDVFTGGGRGQGGQVFLAGANGFTPMPQPALLADRAYEDAGADWLDVDGDKDLDLVVASAGYELPIDDPRLQVRLYVNDGKGHLTKETTFPTIRASASCVRSADVDGDGDRDLFIGARVVPGRYPEMPLSHLLLNDGKGHFLDVTSQQRALTQLGMVTDAAFADLTGDGRPELIVATDFGPVQVVSFPNGKAKVLDQVLPATTGCWNRLLVQDFDQDGKPDIVAANAGLNSQLQATTDRPLTLYGIKNVAGSVLPVLVGYDRNNSADRQPHPFNARDEMLDQVVSLRKKFTDYMSYSKATITDLFEPDELKRAQKLDAATLQTVLFRNSGGTSPSFTMQPLPIEAQVAPAYALAAVDVNHDGLPDLIVGGNREYNRVRLGKDDANRGQLFLNRGKGGFAYVPMEQAGLLWDGDIRDLAPVTVAGRTELLVGATGKAIRVFALVK
ncbi:VCBS repeat-containing protein [Spirosoma radiotolerans]|uniref:Integrin n=1 Tax=Spirosoma radiotolerans TaxID=1379870 RepID=A0A0E3ZTZ4_9BACT|nr:VCBS repeat-containing protein [Spirosoma radiotolerans]AKD54220.1 integrin [Spirosoma radiotolerans]